MRWTTGGHIYTVEISGKKEIPTPEQCLLSLRIRRLARLGEKVLKVFRNISWENAQHVCSKRNRILYQPMEYLDLEKNNLKLAIMFGTFLGLQTDQKNRVSMIHIALHIVSILIVRI